MAKGDHPVKENLSIRQAVRLALLSTGAAAASAPVLAQQTGQEGEIEEIVVTGTRIQRYDLDAVSPVTSVNSEEFQLSGNINIEQKLAELPNTIPSFGPSSNNPGDGTARVDLRGLGTSRTLVLVNGRRWIQSTQFGVVDLNTIPGTLIERVDILTGGSSAVYGSDALAGVVNFQLKQNFEGVEITGLYDITSEGDAEKYNFDITIGGNFDGGRGNAVIYAGYANREPLFQDDRDFSFFALTESTDANGNPILVPGGSSGIPGTRVFGGPTIDPDGVANSGDEFTLGRFEPDGSGAPFVDPDDRFNYAPDNFLQLPQERYTVMGMAHYDISDQFQVYGEVLSVNNKVDQELAPTPAFLSTLEVNPDSPFFSSSVQAALDGIRSDTNGDGVIDDTDNAYLGFIGRRMVENGSRQALNTRDGTRLLIGLRGEINDRWSYDAYYNFSRLNETGLLNNDVSETRFRQAVLVDDSGTACQDPSGGCAPLNIFGAGNISQAAVGFVNVGAANVTNIDQMVVSGSITGELGELGNAGPVMVAFGAEYREDDSSFRPDEFLSGGDVLGFNAGEATVGSFDVTEVFGEVDIPLIADAPFAQEVGIWLAGRYSDYSNIGGVSSYAGALRWAPIDQLRFRAGYQRAVRAPNVGELFQGQAQGFPGATDPCSVDGTAGSGSASQALIDLCVASGVAPADVGVFTQANTQIQGIFGGNPNLQEEESDTFTLGVVVEPIDGLDFTIDYFNIEISDAIDVLGGSVGNVLDICYNQIQDASSTFCQAITTRAGGQPFTRRPDGNVDIVQVLNENIAGFETSGVDFNANYVTDFDAGLFGEGSTLAVNFRSTYLDKYEIIPVVGLDTVFECAGNFGQNACNDAFPEFQAFTRVTWETGPLGISMLWRYISGPQDEDIDNAGTDPSTLAVAELDAANYVDLTFTYQFVENLDVNLGFRNIFDEEPTLIGDQQEQANTFPELYDVFGPRIFLSLGYRWQ